MAKKNQPTVAKKATKPVAKKATKPVAKKATKPVAKKATEPAVENKAVKKEGAIVGMTVETQETGTIQFKDGSGSQDLNILIGINGFDREKVLEQAASLKKKKLMFVNSEPSKKYNKVAGLIKKLQAEGFKLLTSKAAQKKLDAIAG